MLKLLLDEHVSPAVARGLRGRHRSMVVACMAEWEGGEFPGQPDSAFLHEAAVQSLTLAPYDRRPIPPLLKAWAEEGRRHAGLIFVDEKTILPSDTGALFRVLGEFWKATAQWDWANRICFLRR